MDGDQNLEQYWIDPVGATDSLVATGLKQHGGKANQGPAKEHDEEASTMCCKAVQGPDSGCIIGIIGINYIMPGNWL